MEDENKIVLPEYHVKGAVYTYDQLNDFLTDPDVLAGMSTTVNSGKRLQYCNCPASFDIETSSFYVEGEKEPEKCAIMYIWQFGINGAVIYGRTWDEFHETINAIVNYFHLSMTKRLIIYAHNLGFEFQFIKDHFEWDKVFSLKTRVPIYAVSGGLEFRCSYKLSNYSLEYLGSNMLRKYKIEKLVGYLDYSLCRHQKTKLTDSELLYAIYDVYVVMAYIRERMEEEGGDISKVPLTNTGYVRRHCREDTLKSKNYQALMRNLSLTSSEYMLCKRAFMGGFTHANVGWVNQMLNKIGSYDIASDYPARIVLDYFPMSRAMFIDRVSDVNTFKNYLDHYCCIFDLALKNIKPIVNYENILSVSRCTFLEGQHDYISNNGRLVSCDGWIRTSVTEIDYYWLTQFYTWDEWEVKNLHCYYRGYLPTDFVSAVLDFYEKKTTLKGVEGREVEYMVSKNMLNSTYGMMVTDIVRDESEYLEAGWVKSIADTENSIQRYNKSWNRFLFYPWGIYVTAHARSQLFTMISKVEDDYVYSDTDSIKLMNPEWHQPEFEEYNRNITDKIFKASMYHNIPVERFMPRDPSGKPHPIGKFEFEGTYDYFKTCGAKRYIYTVGDETKITVAGLGKKPGMSYLQEKYGPDLVNIYDAFTDGLYVPPGKSGKLTHTYIDTPRHGVVCDYTGLKTWFDEKSATHLEPAPFKMSMLDSFLQYLYGIEESWYTE